MSDQTQTLEGGGIDWDAVKPAGQLGNFVLLPRGQYEMQFISEEITESQNGNPKVIGRWTVLEGEYVGATARDFVTFTVKGAPFLKLRFLALGIKPPRTDMATTAAYYFREANGKIALVTLGITTSENGQEYNEVVNLASAREQTRRPGGTVAAPVAPVDQVEEADVPF